MASIFATTTSRVVGQPNRWRVASMQSSFANGPVGEGEPEIAEGRVCEVELEIQGDDASGFHLIMSPRGFSTADTWHITREDALETAAELFGTAASDWREGPQS